MKPRSSRIPLITSALFAVVALTPAAYAADWLGNTDANFGTVSNWSDSASPNNKALGFGVAGTAGATLNNDLVGATYTGLTFNSGASAFTIGGNSFTLSGGITNNSASAQTINNAITLSNAVHTFNAASGNLLLGGGFSGTTRTLTFSGSNTTTLSGTNTFDLKGINFSAFAVTGNLSVTGATTVDGTGFTDYRGYYDQKGNSTVTVQSGGSLAINTSTRADMNSGVGNNAAGTSTLHVNGGAFSLNGGGGFFLGNNVATATGVLTISSGTATINRGSTTATDARSFIAIGRDLANGTINLNGGVLATDRNFVRDGSGATANGGTANFNFGGGTLKALADQTDWLNSSLKNTNQQALSAVTATNFSTIDANGFSVAINSNISGTGGFDINSTTGTGTVTLGGTNSYTGATTVTDGTLVVNGNISTSVLTTVNSGATLGGSGTIGDVTVLSGGTMAPGNSPGTINVGNFDLQSGSTLVIEITGNLPGTEYDQVNVTGSATLAGLLNVTLSSTPANNDLFFILLNDGTDAISGTFSGLADNDTFSVNGQEFQISYFGDSGTSSFTGGNDVVLKAIPEPGAALLGSLGVLALLRRRRN